LEKLVRGQEAEAEVEPEEEEIVDATPTSQAESNSTAPVATAEPPPVIKPPTPPVTPAPPNSVRHFEFVGGSSQKFWEISISDSSVTVRFGRIGTAGQTQMKSFADQEKAQREAEKLIAEKVKKGYTEKQS
jgi:predicted DNA-binding WGR domain protein